LFSLLPWCLDAWFALPSKPTAPIKHIRWNSDMSD
jgi:hypothetical protein